MLSIAMLNRCVAVGGGQYLTLHVLINLVRLRFFLRGDSDEFVKMVVM
ncbi:hypothetical protein T4B_12734 [Trichinella pseudospiralis]|uniref:Uncharacterized protein n=1 Tax=Trichinella pseudospiralis TaxID=6337 RepID=A0A0V1GLB1_TRIPS|nr:hypothetical protein T4B_12734 [Trichinella pseudospiralis]